MTSLKQQRVTEGDPVFLLLGEAAWALGPHFPRSWKVKAVPLDGVVTPQQRLQVRSWIGAGLVRGVH
eukprot:1290114-Amphidinium_carterae.1